MGVPRFMAFDEGNSEWQDLAQGVVLSYVVLYK